MNIIRITLNNQTAKKWSEGFLIQNKGDESKITNLQFEAKIENPGIDGCIEALERFKGTEGIKSIHIDYKE